MKLTHTETQTPLHSQSRLHARSHARACNENRAGGGGWGITSQANPSPVTTERDFFSPVVSIHPVRDWAKLQAPVYDILPSTTAVFSYTIASRKLSANEQFFVGAQTVVSLLQTTQIKQGASFIAANKVYTQSFESRRNSPFFIFSFLFLFYFTQGGCVTCLRACFGVRLLLLSY